MVNNNSYPHHDLPSPKREIKVNVTILKDKQPNSGGDLLKILFLKLQLYKQQKLFNNKLSIDSSQTFSLPILCQHSFQENPGASVVILQQFSFASYIVISGIFLFFDPLISLFFSF